MTLLSDLRDLDLEKQLKLLGNEIASLKSLAASRSNAFYRAGSDSAPDNYADLARAISSVLPSLFGRRTRRGVIANHPAGIAMVGLLVVGFAANFLFKRWPAEPSERERPVRQSIAARATSPRRAASTRAAPSRTASPRTARSRKSTERSKVVDEPTENANPSKADQ